MTADVGIGMRSERVALLPGVEVRVDGDVTELHTPSRRDFHVGNQLLLASPPEPGSLRALRQRWRAAYAGTGARRLLVDWEAPLDVDAAAGYGDEAATLGLRLEAAVVLVADSGPTDAGRDVGVRVRPVAPGEWPAVVAAYLRAEPEVPQDFARWQLDRYADLVRSGRARWWLLEVDGVIAASAGLVLGDGLARFQQVVTVPAQRRRGHAQRLVTATLTDHATRNPGVPAVIVAEDGSSAERIYRRVGFTPVSRIWSLAGDPTG